MPQVLLSNLTLDYEQFRQQFFADLLIRDKWTDLSPTGTGVSIVEWLSSLGTYDTFAIERALQETMLDTARQPNSIYTIARMLGVHLYRKIPASTTVQFANDSPTTLVTVPIYSQFTINGRNYFNRDAFIFNVGDTDTKVITLYEGTVSFEQIAAQGGDFQRYYIGGTGINISDNDLLCLVNTNVLLTSTTDPLWKLAYQERKFYENSQPDFSVEVVFGNDVYGYTPAVNDLLTFVYATTNGAAGNYATSGENVLSASFPTISGLTLTPSVGGADEKDVDFYRIFAPMLFSANGRMVTRDDYKATTLTYPGVLDCSFRGQAEIGPNRLEWMNTIEYTILAEPSWTDAQHSTFIKWVNTKGIYQTRLQRRDPQAVPLSVTALVYCKPRANLTQIYSLIQDALVTLTTLRPGSLGYSMYRSDIIDTIKNASSDVEYVDLLTPSTDIVLTDLQYIAYDSATLTMNYSTRISL